MRVHWAGIYGVGIVMCALGFIWLPEYRSQFVFSAIVFGIAAFWGIATEGRHDEREEVFEEEPETLVSSGWPTETGEKE